MKQREKCICKVVRKKREKDRNECLYIMLGQARRYSIDFHCNLIYCRFSIITVQMSDSVSFPK